jgi:hypothetical protein
MVIMLIQGMSVLARDGATWQQLLDASLARTRMTAAG